MCSMSQKISSLLRIVFLLSISCWYSVFQTEATFAQIDPFLISPYFGQEWISQNYSNAHKAIDLGMGYENVLAASDGTLGTVDWFNDNCHQSDNNDACGFGLYVRIDHSNGYRTCYAHLSSTSFGIESSNIGVYSGQVIGTSGHTGYSTAPHLHFEVRSNPTTYVNPFSPNLWKDGELATPSRPIPAPANGGEIQIDDNTNNTGGFSKGNGGPFNNQCTGNCANWTRSNNFYWTYVNGSVEDSWAKWQPSLPTDGGVYEVFVFIPNDATNTTTWQAAYTVVHAGGTSKAVIDQLGSRNRWISIETYRMTPGANPAHSVYLTDASGSESSHCLDELYLIA